MANWSSNFVLSAPVNSQDFDFHLKEPVFDYTVTESPKLNPVSLFYDFKLNLDVMGRVFEFLFSPEDDENFIQINHLWTKTRRYRGIKHIIQTVTCRYVILNGSCF
jgi:hypothetical protein